MLEIIRAVAAAVEKAPPERRRQVRETIERHWERYPRSWRNAPSVVRRMVEAVREASVETDAEKIGAWRGGPGKHPAVDKEEERL